jgi:hypothetical protein
MKATKKHKEGLTDENKARHHGVGGISVAGLDRAGQ